MDLLTKARFTMRADILRLGEAAPDDWDIDDYGVWVDNQDPLTGDIVQIWEPYPDDPDTDDVDESVKLGTIKCIARGVVDGGIRVAGSTERFGDMYQNIDYVKMWVPAKTIIQKNDRITNIRDRCGHLMWLDEFHEGNPRAIVFNVNGIVPLYDAFNKRVEKFILLERADAVQGEEV